MNVDLNIILQGVAIILIAWGLKGISTINGSIRELNVWRKEHEKLDNSRHETIKEQVSAVWRKLDG